MHAMLRARRDRAGGELGVVACCFPLFLFLLSHRSIIVFAHPLQTQCASLSNGQAAAVHENLKLVVTTACENEADSDFFPKDWLFHFRWTGKKVWVCLSLS